MVVRMKALPEEVFTFSQRHVVGGEKGITQGSENCVIAREVVFIFHA